MAENSVAAAIDKTETLLVVVKPHEDDALGLMALGCFLPVASKALKTISEFKAEVPVVLKHYISTCDKLTKAIQIEDSGGSKTCKHVVVEDKSWFAHLKTLQLYIQTLQAQAITKKSTTPLPRYDEPPSYTE